MGFWRSLRRWWSWDGSPDTDPFRDLEAAPTDTVSLDVSGHVRAPVDPEPADQVEENDD
jgi:hypothetical protein